RKSAGTIAAQPAPTHANPTSAGTVDRVTSASVIPAHVSSPPTRASPDTPQRTTNRSPTRRANAIATENTTTPPAATAALVRTGPARNTALQFIVADSTNMQQNTRNAGRASAPRGNAKCAVSTAASAAPGSNRGTIAAASNRVARATSGNWRRGPAPAAAAPAAIADPPRRPRLQAPWSADRSGRPARCSSATACVFAPPSRMPTPAPNTHAARTSKASEGANAASVRPPAEITRPSPVGPRLPKRDASQP